MPSDPIDVIIVGAGPAGLSAALVLARACRRVLVFDHGHPRNGSATAIHGYKDADLVDQPTFDEVWPEFLAFVGADLLVAHNGQQFDVPVLRRLAAELPGLEGLVFFDTLPLARSLLDESARLEDLAHRFGVSVGRSHHALDDAGALAGVLRHLGEQQCKLR